ncbi:MAG TPA: hypothetical protein VLE91_01940 [Candidatus Saccharimonadales bacterium]|nr:hypothetical protein [Candidatus Saccharimonadales bacterium]
MSEQAQVFPDPNEQSPKLTPLPENSRYQFEVPTAANFHREVAALIKRAASWHGQVTRPSGIKSLFEGETISNRYGRYTSGPRNGETSFPLEEIDPDGIPTDLRDALRLYLRKGFANLTFSAKTDKRMSSVMIWRRVEGETGVVIGEHFDVTAYANRFDLAYFPPIKTALLGTKMISLAHKSLDIIFPIPPILHRLSENSPAENGNSALH